MKCVLFIGDGMADDDSAKSTPLERAVTPNLDRVAREGRCGKFRTIPAGFTPGSDVAISSILGYDPTVHYTGRGPLEAAARGIDLGPEDLAARCNLVHLEGCVLVDYSAGHVETSDARELVEALQRELGAPGTLEFVPGVSYRHLLILRGNGFGDAVECYPPHDHVGKPLSEISARARTPAGERTAALFNQLVEKSRGILEPHPVNARRAALGKVTANAAWCWSPGRKPRFDTIPQLHGTTGAVVTAVDLVRGLGILAGLEVVDVPGATGYLDTNFEGKARAALDALRRVDLVVVHVEAPDEAGHEGDFDKKVEAIELLDERCVGPLLEGLERLGDPWRFAACADHPTPVSLRAHSDDPPPVALLDPTVPGDGVARFVEGEMAKGALGVFPATRFLSRYLLQRV